MTEINIKLNDQNCVVDADLTILQAAQANGIDIPNLCYEKRLKPYAACGICLVEVVGSNKLARACETKLREGMEILTESPKAVAARTAALELLLSDHCGDCRPPCRQACPGETDCQGYVGLIANGFYQEAVQLMKESYPLPASLGRVCPHPCEQACRRGLVDDSIAIAWLKQFAADLDLQSENPYLPACAAPTGRKIAVIGGGPAGLTFAYFMAIAGHDVTIYDKMPQAGGMLRYGIPEYRLPKAVLDAEIALVAAMGVKFVYNYAVDGAKFQELRSANEIVYLAIGAWQSSGLRCQGEEAAGVLGGIDFLRDVALGNKVKLGDKVAVVGGGNTAMDACRTAVRLGAKEVYLLYRRTKAEMPADAVEITEAEEEGVIFKYLVAPTEVLTKKGRVCGIRLQQMELGEPDASGRRRPVAIPDAFEELELSTIIAAIGQQVVPIDIPELELTKWQTIVADTAAYQTNLPGVFAGGDGINDGPGIAIEAIGHAQRAAKAVNAYLAGEKLPTAAPYLVQRTDLTAEDFAYEEKIPRLTMGHSEPAVRRNNFEEINTGYTAEQASCEAERCLECGCGDVFECKLLIYANRYHVQPQKYSGEEHHHVIHEDHPFIAQDANKCVLCGNCVRLCDEVVGVAAIGLANRGFDTIVRPDFGTPLLESSCIACGGCVDVCPTGALQERHPELKQVPLNTQITPSVCNYCSVGCAVNIHSYGNMIAKVTPRDNELCMRGRFGFPYVKTSYALSPRIDGNVFDVQTALDEAANRIAALQAQHGAGCIAIALGGRVTNEEVYLAQKMLGQEWDKTQLYQANLVADGLGEVLGEDCSTMPFDGILGSDVIIVCGGDLAVNQPMLAQRVRRAVAGGAKLIMLSSAPSELDKQAQMIVPPGAKGSVAALVQLNKALLDLGCAPQVADNLDLLRLKWQNVEVSEQIRTLALIYKNADNAAVIFDAARLQGEAGQLLADAAVLAGQIGREHAGIIALRSQANLQGLIDFGVRKGIEQLLAAVNRGSVKGLLLLGHDLPPNVGDKLDFLLVADTLVSDIAVKADIVLPWNGFGQCEGSYTNAEGRVQYLQAATQNLQHEMSNVQMLVHLMQHFPACTDRFGSMSDIRAAIAEDVPNYACVYGPQQAAFTGVEGDGVRCRYGYLIANGKAQLAAFVPDKMQNRTLVPADNALAAFDLARKEFGLDKKVNELHKNRQQAQH